MSILFVVFLTTFREKPLNPPSAVATQAPSSKNTAETYSKIKENKNFILAAIYYFFMFGTYATFGNFQSKIYRPFGMEIYEMTALGCIGILFGVVGAFIFGRILDRTKKYKFFLKAIPALVIVELICFLYALPRMSTNDKLPIVITTLIFCITLLPVIPLLMQFSIEVTFPLNASTGNGICLMLGHAGAFIFSMTATELTKQDWTV